MRLKASHNLSVQLLLKQGQIEIDPGPYVHNLEHCLLINRREVEALNKIIKVDKTFQQQQQHKIF